MSGRNQPLRSSGRESAQTSHLKHGMSEHTFAAARAREHPALPVGVHASACRSRHGARQNSFRLNIAGDGTIQAIRSLPAPPTLKRTKVRAPRTGRSATHTLQREPQQKG